MMDLGFPCSDTNIDGRGKQFRFFVMGFGNLRIN